MPCNTDHMEPTASERHRKEAAQLAAFVAKIKMTPPPDGVHAAAQHVYGEGVNADEVVAWLCKQMRSEHTAEQRALLFDIENATSRRLVEWWNEHQRVDAQREYEETIDRRIRELQNVWIIWDASGQLYHSFADNSAFAEDNAERIARDIGGAYAKAGFVSAVKFPSIQVV